MTDWFADGISCGAPLLAAATYVDSLRRGRRQDATDARVAVLEEERRTAELRPELTIERVADGEARSYLAAFSSSQ